MSDVNLQQLLTRLTRLEDQVSRLVSRDMLDIEEWTVWTPTLEGGTTAGTYTYTTREGYYFRVDDMVFVLCRVVISGITVAGTGSARIAGLPYTAVDTTAAMVVSSNINLTAGYSRVVMITPTGNAIASIFEEGDDVRQAYGIAGIATGDIITFSGFYKATV